MRAYIIRRLLLLVPTVLLVSLMVFFLIRLLPGDIPLAATGEVVVSEGIRHAAALTIAVDVRGSQNLQHPRPDKPLVCQ